MTAVKKCSNRKFCTLPEEYQLKHGKCRPSVGNKLADFSKLIKYIDENVVGRNITFLGPFGRRRAVYCDYTASARALNFIEDYILKEVLPLYGSSQTSTNVTTLQSALYKQEAHDIICNAVHASQDDVIIFAGNGCTGALHKLIHSLDLEEPPVVFVGPSENNSVLLPLRETGAKIIRIAETKEGFLDLIDLENKLQIEKQLLNNIGSKAQFIGCFSAASNITGILADDIATTILLHQYGAYSFWDYGTAAPYVSLDMNPLLPGNDKGVYKDALFFSGHKFIGGVQSSGVLIVKKQILRVDVPERISHENLCHIAQPYHTYLQDVVKQEFGTGTIVNSIRMGLAMHLKQTVGPLNILSREQKLTKTVLSFIRTIPEIILLGNGSHTVKRLPIFSFLVRHPRGVFLHHNFVCAVLNDIFGIQARGNCACASTYAYDLLGIDEKLSNQYDEILSENRYSDGENCGELHSAYEMLKPGFTRISLPYFMSDSEVTFILEAVKMVATEGWKLLPQYILYPATGEWKHRTNTVFRERKWLSSFRFVDGKMVFSEKKLSGQSPFPQDSADCLHMARNIFNKARKMAHRYPLTDQRVVFDGNIDKLRWFMLPSEAQDLLLGNCQKVKTLVPFTPGEYRGSRNNSISTKSSSDSDSGLQKNTSPLLDVSSMYCRHNSLTSFETSLLKRSSSFFGDKACSDCGHLSSFHAGPRREASPMSRTRCYSLESSTTTPSSKFLLSENGHCSCGSQTDISDAESAKDGQTSADFSDFGDMGINTLFPNTENGNIQAYVKGVTEELATEIKTEIREVIATVDNVLSESSENLDINSLSYDKRFSQDFRRTSSTPLLSNANSATLNVNDKSLMYYTPTINNFCLSNGQINNGTRRRICSYDSKRNAVSCSDSQSSDVSDHVAVYLAELTSEMVTEMKSELREMVNAVDEIISPSNGDKSYATNSDSLEKQKAALGDSKAEWLSTDDSSSQNENECEDIKTNGITVPNKKVKNKEFGSHEIKLLSKSDSSTDSGVVMNTKESPIKLKRKISVIARETKSISNIKDEIIESQLNVEFKIDKNECLAPSSTLDKRKRSFENVSLLPKWHCPPKSVWKPTVEALREYDMIREGDRVLICLSGGKDSLSLLHTLHQYQYYSQSYGITFTFGAFTLDPGNVVYDPRPLIPYLHALGVHYLYDEQKIHENREKKNVSSIHDFHCHSKRSRLYQTAKKNNYNVLALGQHFDDMVENFFSSIFHYGKLHPMKAHYYSRNSDLRVIRPFIYVREKHLRQFAENRKFPIINETCSTYVEVAKKRHRTRQLLAQQEILNPKLFANLKSALQPLIGFKQINEDNIYKKKKYNDSNSVFIMFDTDEEEEEEEEEEDDEEEKGEVGEVEEVEEEEEEEI